MSFSNRTRALTTVVLSLLVGACANNAPFDPDDPRLENARLEIVGQSALNMRFDEAAELHVRYVDGEGEVIANAPISYEIEGDSAGSRLVAFETTTNEEGEASMTLNSGSNSVIFDVSVTPPRGAHVTFNVSVSDAEAGSIQVNMSYGGAREFVRFDAYVFTGERCADIDPLDLPTALRPPASVTSIDQMPSFAGIAVGDDYTVGVLANNGSAVAGFGCRDSQAVVNNETTEVSITIQDTDIAPNFSNTWDLDNRFDFAGALPNSVETVLDILDELTDDDFRDSDGDPAGETSFINDGDDVFPEFGVDPGAFVTEMAMRQTCRWECDCGSDCYDSCEQVNSDGSPRRLGELRDLYFHSEWFALLSNHDEVQSRFPGGCVAWSVLGNQAQDLVNDQIPSGFVTDWLNLTGDLARAITDARIASELTINPPSAQDEFILPIRHRLVSMTVPYRDPTSTPPGMMSEATFMLEDAGFTDLEITESVTVDGLNLTIPEHSFTLNWGELVLYIYRNVLLPAIFGVNSTGDLLAQYVACDDDPSASPPVVGIGTRLRRILDDNGFGGPSATTLAGYCDTALAAAGGLLESQLEGLLDAEGTLTISGTATGAGVDEATGDVSTLENGMWLGMFGEGTVSRPVTGTFTGARRAE